MSTELNTPTPRTDAEAGTLIDADEVVPAVFARKLERELTALTAERDQLRAEVERLTNQRDNLLKPMREQAIARAERAEDMLGKLQRLHGCSQEMVVPWCEHAAKRSLELDFQVARNSDLFTQRDEAVEAQGKAEAELAAERARVDWLQAQEVKRGLEITEGRDDPLPFLVLGEDGTTHWGDTYRAAIDAAMKQPNT